MKCPDCKRQINIRLDYHGRLVIAYAALAEHHWNRTITSKVLRIDRRTLRLLIADMKKCGWPVADSYARRARASQWRPEEVAFLRNAKRKKKMTTLMIANHLQRTEGAILAKIRHLISRGEWI
jgi:hypothetical protein